MQPELFHERFEDALAETIAACGGRKAIAGGLWPDKPQRDAHNLIDACLNPERREKFSPSQLIYILKKGREAGSHAAAMYLARECGYDIKPIVQAEEVDRLTTVIEQSTKQLAGALAMLDRIQGRGSIKSVS